MLDQINQTVSYLKNRIGDFQPEIGIVLGTGLGKLVNEIEIIHQIEYSQIPNFVRATVEFHAERLIFGKIAEKKIICMQGRFHFYEGYTMQEVTFPIRVMKTLGVEYLFISNASGGLNPAFSESDVMIINDHISLFLPTSPLVGKNIMGDRFPDMSEPYSKNLIEKAKKILKSKKIEDIKEGVYVSVVGPQLETKAEYRMLRLMGADAVGMSTVPEVIVAHQMGIKVFGISAITDMCLPENLKVAELSKILEAAAKAEPKMTMLIKEIILDL